MELIDGDEFQLIELETFIDSQKTYPRVRPLNPFPTNIRVEFPMGLREEHPIGTRFRADVMVRQKHNKDGRTRGPIYLRAYENTIIRVESFTPEKMLMALQKPNSASGRAYEYVELGHDDDNELPAGSLQLLRTRALSASSATPAIRVSEIKVPTRNNIVKLYALARSNGICEACDEPAPFIRKNTGEPYLEVHHIIELSQGGPDSPHNVAAICPNCHRRVTHGEDDTDYNEKLKAKVKRLEDQLTSS
jgi:hypothetical protein